MYIGVPFVIVIASEFLTFSYIASTYCNERLPAPSLCINDFSPLSTDGYFNALAVNPPLKSDCNCTERLPDTAVKPLRVCISVY